MLCFNAIAARAGMTLPVLPSPIRKRDRGWYETLPSIWSQWILEGVVENDNIPSMRTLAHIYDAIKDRSPKGNTGKVMPARAK